MSDAHPRPQWIRDGAAPEGDAGGSCKTSSFEWDRETNLLTCSPEWAAMLEMQTSTAVTLRDHLAQIPEPDRGQLTELLAGLTPTRPTYCTGYRLLTTGQRTLILEEHGWARFDASGQLTRRLGIVTDVTARRQAEADLQQSEKRLHLALAAAHGGTWFLDPETGDCIFSEEARKLLELPADAPSTLQAVLAKVHPSDRPGVQARIETAKNRVAPYQVEFRVILPDGSTRWIAVQAEPCDATGGDRRLLGLVQDISERRSTEEELRAVDRRKDQFLAMLAHELRNPLTPVRNATEILRSVDSDDPRLRQAVRIIDRQTTHMERLIEDLLDVARISQGGLELKREDVALADVLTQAIELSRHRIEERGQRLDLRLCPPSVRLSCDPVRLCQVFANLIDNAAKYTDEGGEIRMQARANGSEALIRVSDTGRGITAEELPYLFNGLARKRPRPAPPLAGLGLGLSIVKRLVSMHEGKVSATSAGIGQGSCFEVRLPLEPCLESASGSRLAGGKKEHRSQIRILVVDDDQDIAESTAMLLQSMGHEVDLATSGKEALGRARERRHQLVLLDIELGDTDGLEVARRLRQLPHGRDMRIAAVTGYGDTQTRREVRAAGIDRHLLKPLRPEALGELLRSLTSSTTDA